MLKAFGIEKLTVALSVILAVGIFGLLQIRERPKALSVQLPNQCHGDLAHQYVQRMGNDVLDGLERGLANLKDQTEVIRNFKFFLGSRLFEPIPPQEEQLGAGSLARLHESVRGSSYETFLICFPRLQRLVDRVKT
jgi:hypothetical protein